MSIQVAVYTRVSTLNQVQAQTIDQQLQRLRAHIETQGWQLLDKHIFRDDGYSGATLNRPGLDKLRDAIRWGEITHLLITDPDRLARKYVHQMILLEEFARFGCHVEFLDHPMSDDPHDQLLLQIRGAVAEYERTLITDRMRRGRLAKYQAGTLLPWTRPPYGYRLDPDRPRDPVGVWVEESEAAIVREIFALYTQENHSLQGVATHLQKQGVPTPSGKVIWSLCTLRAILRQPAYLGQVYARRRHYRPARIRRSATHPIGQPHQTAEELPPEQWILVATIPAIINQEQFDQAQTRLAQNQSFAKRNNKAHHYLLRALVSCGRCQSACTGRYLKSGHSYYVCSAKGNPIHSRKEEKCPSRFIPAQQLDDVVWQDLCDVITHPESITYALDRAHGGHWLPQELQARRESLRRGCAQLQQQLDRLTDAYLNGVIPLAEYQRRRGDLEQRIAAFKHQAEQLHAQANRQTEVAGLVKSVEDFCQRLQTSLQNATFEQRRQIIELLIDRVIVDDGDVEIRYAIPTTPESEHVRFCHLRSDYFAHPHLLRIAHLQVLDQVVIACKPVAAVGGAAGVALHRPQGIHRAHHPLHPLTVHAPAVWRPSQLVGHPARAIGRKLSYHTVDGRPQLSVIGDAPLIVVAAAGQLQQITQRRHGHLLLFVHLHRQFAFPFGAHSKYLESFFAVSSSSVKRPTSRSSSPMRWSRLSWAGPDSNTRAARSMNCCFQRDNTLSLMPYSRLAWPRLLPSTRISITTLALNSGAYVFRLTMWTLLAKVYSPLSQLSSFVGPPQLSHSY
jgi:site-specific DNA recombinase